MNVRGTVTVDGEPLELGLIHFERQEAGKKLVPGHAGSAIENGHFQVAALAPGKYRVTVEGAKKTGKKMRDLQRGEVEERIPLTLREPTLEIELSPENAQNLEVKLSQAK